MRYRFTAPIAAALLMLASFVAPATYASTSITVDFNSPATGKLSGEYPTGLINWGSVTSQWEVEAAGTGGDSTQSLKGKNHNTTANFVNSDDHLFSGIDAYNADSSAETFTLTCGSNTLSNESVPANSHITVITGWTTTCESFNITDSATNHLYYDNMVFDQTSTATLGNTAIGPTAVGDTGGVVEAWPFIAGNSVTVNRFNVYIDGSALSTDATLQVAVYDDSSGKPGAREASACNISIAHGNIAAWYRCNWSSSGTPVSGQKYWLAAVQTTNNVPILYMTSSGCAAGTFVEVSTTTGALPSTWNNDNGTAGFCNASIFMDFTP